MVLIEYAVVFAAGVVIALVLVFLFRRKRGGKLTLHSSIEYMKSIGHLSVYKAYTREIVTEIDHTWGEFGRKYLTWLISEKKMAMIFEFEIDFRYDLKSADFTIERSGEGEYVINMPACIYELHINNISFYDEQGARLLPWLLPDLISKYGAGRFSETDKNRMVAAAIENSRKKAIKLITSIEKDVQNSAISTLNALCRSFGVDDPEFRFSMMNENNLKVMSSEEEIAK